MGANVQAPASKQQRQINLFTPLSCNCRKNHYLRPALYSLAPIPLYPSHTQRPSLSLSLSLSLTHTLSFTLDLSINLPPPSELNNILTLWPSLSLSLSFPPAYTQPYHFLSLSLSLYLPPPLLLTARVHILTFRFTTHKHETSRKWSITSAPTSKQLSNFLFYLFYHFNALFFSNPFFSASLFTCRKPILFFTMSPSLRIYVCQMLFICHSGYIFWLIANPYKTLFVTKLSAKIYPIILKCCKN